MDGFSILIAICVIVSVTVVNDVIKEKQFEELNAKTAKAEAIVVRNGNQVSIDTEQLVVGDI